MTDTKPPRLNPEAQKAHDEAKAKWIAAESPMATLILGEGGKPVVQEWSDWIADSDLRWFSELPQKPARLQQRHYRRGIDSTGAICEWEYAWRDVPTTIGEMFRVDP